MKAYRFQIYIRCRTVMAQIPAKDYYSARFLLREVLAKEFPGVPYKIRRAKIHKIF